MREALYSPISTELSEPFVHVESSPVPSAHRQEPLHRKVYIYVNVFSVSGIDTIAQQFDCHFFIRAMWMHSDLDGESWEPQLVFMNAVSTVEVGDPTLETCSWRVGPGGEKVLRWGAECRGSFKEPFELQHFPFDVQALTITISCKHFASEVTLLEDCFNGTKSILRSQFTLTTQFDLSGPFMQAVADEDLKKYPLLHVYFVGERRAAYYMWNIALPNFLLSMLVFTSFAIPRQDLADRLSVTLTLVLTSVAFKYMVAQELPRISYLTLLDTYILLSFAFLALVGGQNAFSALYSQAFEDHSCLAIVGVFLSIHVVIGLLSVRYICFETSKCARLRAGNLVSRDCSSDSATS